MKTICISGTIGKDAVLRRTQGGDPVLGFSVAVDDGFGENKRTMWFDVALWGKRGQSLEPHLRKGLKVSVSGDLGTREHEGKTYFTVRANEITMMGVGEGRGKPEREQTGYDYQDEQRKGGAPANFDDLDQIPFAPAWR